MKMKIFPNTVAQVAKVNEALVAPIDVQIEKDHAGCCVLPRPTLLVPIHLDALVVDADFYQDEARSNRADTQFRKIDPFNESYKGVCEFYDGAKKCPLMSSQEKDCEGVLATCSLRQDIVKPNPFVEQVTSSNVSKAPTLFAASEFTLQEGIHLHWAMPDALTKGYVIGEEEKSEVVFPELPNRWLVVRTVVQDCCEQPDDLPEFEAKKQCGTAWVVVADGGQLCDVDGTGEAWHRIVRLEDYDEDKCKRQHLTELTAVSGGDPSALVFYDSCYDTFGFHDTCVFQGTGEDEKNIFHGPVSYQVFGWFAGDVESPFADITSKEELKRILEGYKWSIGLDMTQESEALAGDGNTVAEDEDTPFSRLFWNHGCEVLCHASVHGVKFKQTGFENLERRPTGDDLFIGLGSSQEGALGGWLSYALGNNEGYGRLLAGLMDGHLADVTRMTQMNSFNYLIHKRGFASFDGGTKRVPIQHTTFEPIKRDLKKTWVGFEKLKYREIVCSALQGREVERATPSYEKLFAERAIDPIANPASQQYQPNSMKVDTIAMRDDAEKWRNDYIRRRPVPQDSHFMEQPLPRFYQPKDPVLVIARANRGVKHGEDGRFDDAGNLLCRLGGDCIQQVRLEYYETDVEYIMANVDFDRGRRIYANPISDIEKITYSVEADELLDFSFLSTTALPFTIRSMVGENILFDSASVERFVELVTKQCVENNHPRPNNHRVAYLATCYIDQVYARPQEMADAGFASLINQRDEALKDAQQSKLTELARTFTGNGRLPSPHGLRSWEQPWTPIHLDWQVSITPSIDGLAAWELDGAVFKPCEGERIFDDESAILLEGRSLLTAGAAKTMHKALQAALLQEQNSDYIADDIESSLSELTTQMGMVNLIGSSLGGFHDMLLGKVEEYLMDDESVASHDVLLWIREGQLTVHQLRIVDSFGRYLDTTEIPSREDDTILGTEGVFTLANKSNSLLIPPRINAPARFTFRFLDGNQNGLVEADERYGTSGICGWCMPDHLDGSLEFFDKGGHNLGQLREEKSMLSSHSNVIWEGVPGQDGSYGEPLVSGKINNHLYNMINGIRSWNEFDQTEDADESSLSALIRAVDVNGWGVDPFGRTGSDHIAVLLGKPLAIVRAKIMFEVKPDSDMIQSAKYDDFCRIPFPALIGNVREKTDGVMGFFINDDYQHLHLPDPESKELAFADGIQGAKESKPITHPYVFDEHALYVRVGQTVVLTLLVDPRGGIHASTGILPQKRLDLIQEEVKPALDTMAVTFKIGPVLVDPSEVKMPHPNEIKGNWNWLHRASPVMWQEQPITPANDRAHFSGQNIEAHEGWLKFSGGVGENS